MIYDIYGTRNVFLGTSKPQLARLEAMPLEKRLSYSGIGGHASLPFFREMLGDMERYHKIIILRDPIERVISEFNYIRKSPLHPLHNVVAAQDFEAYISKTSRLNRQVKLLTGSAEDSEGAFEIVTRFFDDWSMSADVGEMAERLYEVTGTPPRSIGHKNKGKSTFNRSDLPPATLRLLEELCRHDLALVEALKRTRHQ